MRHILWMMMAAAVLAAAPACTPTLPGPQLTDLPPGLGYVSPRGEPSGRQVLGRPLTSQRSWVSPTEPGASLTISELSGAMTRSELSRWLEANPDKYVERGAVTDARIDGRSAWTWIDGATGSKRAWAVIPYRDATFVVALYSAKPELQDDGRLRQALASFSRAPEAASRVLVPVGAVVLAGLGAWAFMRFRSPPPPPRVVSRPLPPPPSPLSGGR